MDRNNKRTYVTLFLLITAVFAINVMSFKNGHNWGDDFAEYINYGMGIIDGTLDELFLLSRYRVEHSTVPTGSVNMYWGLPLLISPVYYVFGFDIHVFKIYIYLFFICGLFIIYLLFKDRLCNLKNILLVAIIGFNPFYFNFKDSIVSDIPYFFFSLLGLFLIKRLVMRKEILLNRHADYVLLGVIIFFSTLIRPVGIVLLPTLLLVQYMESRASSESIKDFIVSDKARYIPYVIFVILSVISTWTLPMESMSRDSDLLVKINIPNIIFNIKYHLAAPANYLPYFNVRYSAYGFGYDKVHLVLYVVILATVVHGAKRHIKDDYLFVVYMLLNFLVFLAIPGRSHRFFMPLFPFFIYFLLLGLSSMSLTSTVSGAQRMVQANAAYVVGAGLLLVSMAYTSHATYKNMLFNDTGVVDGPYTPDSIELFNYIKEHTKEDDAVIFHKPRAMSLYTGRKSFSMGNRNFTPGQAFNSDAGYIALSKKKYLAYDLTREDFQGKLECEFENNSFLLCDLKKANSL